MHLRIKHPSHNNGSSNPRSLIINPNAMLQPSTYQDPMFDMKIEHPAIVPFPAVPRISPPSLTPKSDSSEPPLSPSVPRSPHGTPRTPYAHPPRDAPGPAQVPVLGAAQGAPTVPNWGSLTGFSEHIKFSNIPILIIRIGNWKKGTNFYGDMVAKFLYEERKFVWEVYAVTTPAATFFVRIELRFDDITGIAFETNQEVAVLTLDFCHPPTFYQAEIVQHQPVVWNPLAIDVSEGDIFTLRRHVLQFQKDSVIHPLNHLLKVDPRLHSLYASFDTHMYQAQHTPQGMPPTPVVVPSTPFSTPATPATPALPHGPVFSHEHISAHAPSFASYEQAFAASQVPSHLNTSLNMSLPPSAQKNSMFYADTPLSEGEGEEDEEEDMDQDEEEKEEQKEEGGGERGRPHVIPPNPTPHSFHTHAGAQHGDLRTHHDPTYLAHNYYTQSFNTIPMLELDPKDEKPNDRQNRFMQPSPRYSVVVPGGAQQCACGGNYAACLCFKGIAQCSAVCMCARSAYESLTDGTASVPSSTPGIGNFPVDLSF
eukprot:Phypoly_transcript_05548.p1 GENE.Phypoly_transcript_05548~~Phypoly_transcript_05548.p1  ORF type:complete len:538 (+),score=127.83 Phypoly_transcript_05548:320-1933(+)